MRSGPQSTQQTKTRHRIGDCRVAGDLSASVWREQRSGFDLDPRNLGCNFSRRPDPRTRFHRSGMRGVPYRRRIVSPRSSGDLLQRSQRLVRQPKMPGVSRRVRGAGPLPPFDGSGDSGSGDTHRSKLRLGNFTHSATITRPQIVQNPPDHGSRRTGVCHLSPGT